jgi:raffinose synthase
MESGDDSVTGARWESALLIAAGADPFELVDAAVAAAAARSGGARPLAEKRLPPSVDYFGWCSWVRAWFGWLGGREFICFGQPFFGR